MNHTKAELHLRNTRVSNKELDMRALWGCGASSKVHSEKILSAENEIYITL